jgi:hypothetical protein
MLNWLLDGGIMKKIAIFITASLLVSVIFLSGCNEQQSNSDGSRFIGNWKLVDISYEIVKNLLDEQPQFWEIMENGSIKQTTIHYNDPENESDDYTSIYWSVWELTDDKFNMGNETALIPYDYQFLDNYSNLNLTYSESVWFKLEKQN